MSRWSNTLNEAAVGGALASILSAAVLAWAGRRETPSAAAPINAPSQWIWGTGEALDADGPDGRHTLTGYLVHHCAATFWAALHAAVLSRTRLPARPLPGLAAAGVTGAVAALVDLKLTPERLTPGFQHRLSRGAITTTYGAFALGLALGCLAVRRAQGR
ncbi:hypothetical protein EZ313_04160 [Ramlibacter henchirensis]|uniref:DUF1440 domain-containing protein n=1 Tax=Ramlibacter henchirensis TaxID=204072 RepID=A0A4Z0C2S1_9BURK|nr:hypothetical protein [Ramlibacter henchirensis]TFZ05856.1 hypothetical protein EZ313_04160 [Ramlibacter henchirensis]